MIGDGKGRGGSMLHFLVSAIGMWLVLLLRICGLNIPEFRDIGFSKASGQQIGTDNDSDILY